MREYIMNTPLKVCRSNFKLLRWQTRIWCGWKWKRILHRRLSKKLQVIGISPLLYRTPHVLVDVCALFWFAQVFIPFLTLIEDLILHNHINVSLEIRGLNHAARQMHLCGLRTTKKTDMILNFDQIWRIFRFFHVNCGPQKFL